MKDEIVIKHHSFIQHLFSGFAYATICLLSITISKAQGLSGYIVSNTKGGSYPAGYDAGLGFYTAVWKLTPEPLQSLQVGFPATWIWPNNADNTTQPLCPVGTVARDNWPDRGPAYESVFQTMEGGVGLWGANRFQYGYPKFMMNGVPNCYSNQIATPGWPFFSGSSPLPDNMLGIAQLSNRILFPPDGIPFEGTPHGEFLGYSYLALPFSDTHTLPQPTGNNNWTLFVNAKNFKGPVAYFVPETWSKISKDYPFDHGRGLDSRMMLAGQAPGMEVADFPSAAEIDNNGVTYTKSAQMQFPVNEKGETVLYRELAYYSKSALYDDVLNWKNGGNVPTGKFNAAGISFPQIEVFPYEWFGLNGKPIQNSKMTKTVFSDGSFGFRWSGNMENGYGKLPLYYRDEPTASVAINPSDLPSELTLKNKTFEKPHPDKTAYQAELTGAWAAPGPSAGPFTTTLVDGSRVTYYWYKFVDQPVFHQYDWSEEEKSRLQALIEKIHQQWTIDKSYMHPNTSGDLVSFDGNLIVTPPAGLEAGYVPIVTRQSMINDLDCSEVHLSTTATSLSDTTVKAELHAPDFDNLAVVKWSDGHTGRFNTIKKNETYSASVTMGNCTFYHYSAPLALPANGLDGLSFYASWKKVPGAKAYLLEVASEAAFTNKLNGWDGKSIDGTKAQIQRVNGVNNYYYRVRTQGFLNEVSEYSNVVALNVLDAPCSLDLEITKTNTSNASASDGAASAIVKGGQSPYNYVWSNSATTDQISNLSKDDYTLTVTDALGCTATGKIHIGLPIGSNSIGNRVWNDLNRNGFDDFGEPGIAGVNVGIWRDTDGNGIPEDWMGYQTTDANGYYLFTGLMPGTYATFVWEIGNWGPGEALHNMVNTVGDRDPNNDQDADDNGELLLGNIASKPIILTADDEPLLDGDRTSNDFDFDPSGNMTVDFGFYNPDDPCPLINLEIRSAYNMQSTCTLTAFPASGIGPFQYEWNTGESLESIGNVSDGLYQVTVTDFNGCTGKSSIFFNDCQTTYVEEGAIDYVTACDPFTWMDGKTYTSSNHTATFNLKNNAGEDSTVYLHLTIKAIDKSLTVTSTLLTANLADSDYKWIDCSTGGYIQNASDQSYQPVRSGSYRVEVSQNGCTEVSDCQTIVITAIEEIVKGEFKVYPNPTTGSITVALPDGLQEADLKIVNVLGQTELSKKVSGQPTTELKIEGGSGLYFLIVKKQDAKPYVFKIIKI